MTSSERQEIPTANNVAVRQIAVDLAQISEDSRGHVYVTITLTQCVVSAITVASRMHRHIAPDQIQEISTTYLIPKVLITDLFVKRQLRFVARAILSVMVWAAIFEVGLRAQQFLGPLYDLELADVDLSWE
jgi:hypothetical protein